jgi:hypothetical protein
VHAHQIIVWLESLPWKSFAQSGPGILISGIALLVVLYDRRSRLTLRARKGEWYTLTPTMSGGEVIFQGVIEVYNRSGRSNAIRDYRFRCKVEGKWREMESEFYRNTYRTGRPEESEPETANRTPFALSPYSGAEILVQSIVNPPSSPELLIEIDVEDLLGKHYQVQVRAKS